MIFTLHNSRNLSLASLKSKISENPSRVFALPKLKPLVWIFKKLSEGGSASPAVPEKFEEERLSPPSNSDYKGDNRRG